MNKWLKRIIRNVPGVQSLDRYLRRRYQGDEKEPHPRGHFYSPLPDVATVRSQAEALFRKDFDAIPGINLREQFQKALLEELASFYQDFDWPEQRSSDRRYYSDNIMFGLGSAFSLYAMMRHFRPKRIIEVGSGFSSAIMLDTSERFCNGEVGFSFIEPFNDRLLSLLREEDLKRCRIVKDIVQNVDLPTFKRLERNDILFVDSSHVSKIGSDVNFIFNYVLPEVQSGVIVHVHDIYWPFEYPKSWIVDSLWAWNEAYLLRAFLQYNEQFEILQFNDFLAYKFRDLLEERTPRVFAKLGSSFGSSFWMRKI
jgi:hypothetical protein